MAKLERCDVRSGDCDDETRCVCYRCGMPACPGCSKVRPRISLGKGRARICDNCWESEKPKQTTTEKP
jgi:hypothetical protein